MLNIVQALIGMGVRVTLMPDNFAPLQPYTRMLQRMGVEVLYGPLDVNAELGDDRPQAERSDPVAAPCSESLA